jgi:putative Mg2+ transporter-C (MgtC) family protein
MDKLSVSEMAVRLLFGFILGSGVAIETRWYRTKKLLQSTTQMSIGVVMFAILIQITTNKIIVPELVLAVSIVCGGTLIRKQIDPRSINTVIKLWCAGAAGCLVGYGLFVPAYLGILAVVLASWMFKIEDLEFTPTTESDFNDHNPFDSQINFQDENIENIEESISISPKEMHYQCQVICPLANEVEVLALLVQLGKEQKLIPSSLSSHNVVDKNGLSEVQIEIDFVAQEDENSPLQLQQMLSRLKLEVGVSNASWVCLPSGSTQNPEKVKDRRKIINPASRNHRQFVVKN